VVKGSGTGGISKMYNKTKYANQKEIYQSDMRVQFVIKLLMARE